MNTCLLCDGRHWYSEPCNGNLVNNKVNEASKSDNPVNKLVNIGKQAELTPTPVNTTVNRDDVEAFAQAIMHGDAEHRDWLSRAAQQFIQDRTVPPIAGKGAADRTTYMREYMRRRRARDLT